MVFTHNDKHQWDNWAKELEARVFVNANIPVEDYPDGLIVEWRDGFWVGMNYSYDIEQAN